MTLVPNCTSVALYDSAGTGICNVLAIAQLVSEKPLLIFKTRFAEVVVRYSSSPFNRNFFYDIDSCLLFDSVGGTLFSKNSIRKQTSPYRLICIAF